MRKYKPGRDRLYLETYLDRSNISAREYNRFLKKLRKFEVKRNMLEHKISILQRVILKFNRIGESDTLTHRGGFQDPNRKRRFIKSAY